jgi:hypothetical protein
LKIRHSIPGIRPGKGLGKGLKVPPLAAKAGCGTGRAGKPRAFWFLDSPNLWNLAMQKLA